MRRVVGVAISTSMLAALLAIGTSTAGEIVSAATDVTTRLEPIEPCRLGDTRDGRGFEVVDAQTMRISTNACGLPDDATAIVANTTVIGATSTGFLVAYPSGSQRPNSATLNWKPRITRGNTSTIAVGDGGSIDVFKSDGFANDDLTIDVSAAFVPATEATAGRLISPPSARRLLDTRDAKAPTSGTITSIALPGDVPSDATAVAVTLTAVASKQRGFFTLYAAGSERPDTATLNVGGAGQFRSTTAIVPVNEDGFDIYQTLESDVVVDLTGWFSGPSAESSSDGLFVAVTPRRLRDTRPETSPVHASGSLGVPLPTDLSTSAQSGPPAAVALSITMIDPNRQGFITAHPRRTARSETASGYGFPFENTAQFAISAASAAGVTVFSSGGTEMTVDLLGWFTGSATSVTQDDPAPNPIPRQRVLALGDSTMAGVDRTFANSALQGADFTFLARSCRRLVRTSCNGREGPIPPPTAFETLSSVGYKQFDVLVVMTGYNDVMPGFASHVPLMIAKAREKGIRRVVWLTMAREFRTDKGGPGAFQVYQAHNDVIRANAAVNDFMVAVEWSSIIRQVPWWTYSDGIHLDRPGGYGAADFISRSVAHVTGQRCPQPEFPGGSIPEVCPNPGGRPPVDVRGLYRI